MIACADAHADMAFDVSQVPNTLPLMVRLFGVSSLLCSGELLKKNAIRILLNVNPSPAEPGYVLPLQTV